MFFETHSAAETFALGRRMGAAARPGDVISLTGDLGAGKTVFSKGFAEGIGVGEPVTSPTFTILQVYETGRIPLYHFDVYRIGEPDEMDEIGFEDYLYGDGVCLIEWAGRIAELLPPETIRVVILHTPEKGGDARSIEILGLPEDRVI